MGAKSIEQLDLRRGDGNRIDALLRRLEALEPGSPVEVLDRSSLDPVYEALEGRFGPGFDWWVLEDGPCLSRALVARRTDAQGPVTLVGLFGADHARMRALFSTARAGLIIGDRQSAAMALSELRVGLTRHAAGEETLLFPLYLQSGIEGGQATIDGLIRDHEAIQQGLGEVIDLMGCEERFDQPEALKRLEALQRRVQAHEEREERLVLPRCETLLPAGATAGAGKPVGRV